MLFKSHLHANADPIFKVAVNNNRGKVSFIFAYSDFLLNNRLSEKYSLQLLKREIVLAECIKVRQCSQSVK